MLVSAMAACGLGCRTVAREGTHQVQSMQVRCDRLDHVYGKAIHAIDTQDCWFVFNVSRWPVPVSNLFPSAIQKRFIDFMWASIGGSV